MQITGDTTSLSASATRALERIWRRRVPPDVIVSPELAKSLADASRETSRQVGVLVSRMGDIEHVIVGTPTGLMLPDVGRLRAAKGRFRALRLVHTHLFNEGLTHDDLTDLTRLRLDLVAALVLAPGGGEPRSLTWAYNVPKGRGDDEASKRGYELVAPIPWGRPQPNFGELIQALEDEFSRLEKTRVIEAKDGRALLVHVGEKKKGPGAMRIAQSRMAELAALAETAGVEVVDRVIQLRERVDPKFLLGKGRLEQLIIQAIDLDVETLIFDCNLTPTQASAIAASTDLKVLDRSQLILDIFAQRAETKDGKLQVELAQLKYTLPRLGQKDDGLSRLTGGIGGRGPGETKLEIGRRRARERVERLEKQLKELEKQRHERRRLRQSEDIPVIAIVGYTNAGKSTLLNTLTQAGVLAENKLFATLDTRSRRLHLPAGNTIILSDTVGFIRDMPKDLFAAFRATFEEAADADLILELVDGSDPEEATHRKETERLVEELGLGEIPRFRAYNKADRLDPHTVEALSREPDTWVISALDPESLRPLLAALGERFPPGTGRTRRFDEESTEGGEWVFVDPEPWD
ncbi:MAG TPA: GTPase HflX [Polyangiaceae bacterium]|nr:GTPase HflX [Polyangiaceae bacterium]